jgi:hypothetical protein
LASHLLIIALEPLDSHAERFLGVVSFIDCAIIVVCEKMGSGKD